MKIAITAESTIDLPKSLLTEFGIRTLPFSLVMGEKQVLDGEVNSDYLYAFRLIEFAVYCRPGDTANYDAFAASGPFPS